MSAKIRAEITLASRTGLAIADRFPTGMHPQQAARELAAILDGMAAGIDGGLLRLAIDEHTPVAAAGSTTCVVASLAAGDQILLGDEILSCVVGSATAASGQYSKDTSNAACATSLIAAINAYPPTKRHWIASSGGSGVVTVTSRYAGTAGNSTKFRKKVATAAGHIITAFSGGRDASSRVTATITCDQAATDADDTIQIGAVVLTAKASGASGEGQFNLGASTDAMTENLVAKLNAHSGLLGLVTAAQTGDTGLITLTYTCDPRVAINIVLQSSDADGMAVTQPTAASVAYASKKVTAEYALGAL